MLFSPNGNCNILKFIVSILKSMRVVIIAVGTS